MEGFFMTVAVIAMLVGAIGYNSFRRKMHGIIGVGGSYIILLGVMLLVSSIATIFNLIFGNAEVGASAMEIIMCIIFMILCLGYTAYVMLIRCETVAQRILVPIMGCLIGLGFCWRFLMALVFHIPMEGNNNDATNSTGVTFPSIIYDPNNDEYRLQSNSNDHADYYCQKTGKTVQLWEADILDGLPSGWRQA